MSTTPFETTKDPSAIEDYTIDWTTMLAQSLPGDVIINSVWSTSTVPSNSDLVITYDGGNLLLPASAGDFLLPDGVSVFLLPSTWITHSGTRTSVWVSGGGKLHTVHKLVNRVTTAAGRVWDQTILVTMEHH